ncbi:MAG: hypothetical protein CMJ51_05915 [Planctomycetaceae bacterium]|nr:hypothetical protein [Planctomycetaceae bacterium]
MYRASRLRTPTITLATTLLASVTVVGSVPSDDRLPPRGPDESLTVEGVEDPSLRPWFKRLHTEASEAGTTIRISGILEQSHRVSAPPGVQPRWIEEWFVRRDEGDTVALAIPVMPDGLIESATPRDGMRIACEGLEVGRLAVTGRDGIAREWPLFVARRASLVADGSGGMGGVAGIVAATLMAGAGWLFLRRRAATRATMNDGLLRSRTRAEAAGQHGDLEPDLPRDPADAMAVLAKRTEEECSDGRSPSQRSQS